MKVEVWWTLSPRSRAMAAARASTTMNAVSSVIFFHWMKNALYVWSKILKFLILGFGSFSEKQENPSMGYGWLVMGKAGPELDPVSIFCISILYRIKLFGFRTTDSRNSNNCSHLATKGCTLCSHSVSNAVRRRINPFPRRRMNFSISTTRRREHVRNGGFIRRWRTST